MTKHVQAQKGKMILGRKHPDIRRYEPRAIPQSFKGIVVQFGKFSMAQVDVESGRPTSAENASSRGQLAGPDQQIDVAGRAQASLGVGASYRPSLYQNRLDASRSQIGKDLSDLPFLQRRLKSLITVSLSEGARSR
jgi:hypothetical protein